MSTSFKQIQYPSIPDLSQVQFGNRTNELEMTFIQSGERFEESITHSLIQSRVYKINAPDIIQFSRTSEVVKTIQQQFQSITLRELPFSYSHDSGKYEVPASQAKEFFDAIKVTQERAPQIFITPSRFKEIITDLKTRNYLSETETKEIESHLHFLPTLDEVKQTTKMTCDVKSALALANYYKNNPDLLYNTNAALYWLCQANRYTKDSSLDQYVDLANFFQSFTEIDQIGLFDKDNNALLEIMGKCSSIQELSFDGANYGFKTTQQIGKFLKISNSIQSVVFTSSHTSDRLDEKTIKPIAEALESNTSLTSFSISDSLIGNKGILDILDALEKNLQSKVKFIQFRACRMTDEIADRLIAFFQKSPRHIKINIDDNSYLSESKKKEILIVLEERTLITI